MDMNIVVAGAGIAGLSAAKAARDANPDCNIILLEESQHNTYSRTRLPEYISGEINKQELFPYPDEWYEKNRIKLLNSLKITGIDTNNRSLSTNNGIISYNSLVIATGSSGNIPAFPGVDKENVITVRTIEDAAKIRHLGGKGTTCTIIGGGLLGLEMAWAVKQLGCNVNIIEHNPRLLPRQIDEQGAALLIDTISKKGINIFLNSKTQELYGNNKVEGVLLADGTEIASDFVILSVGVKANTAPFANSAIAIDRAIKVDKYLETNIPGIYAAGDVAEFEGKNFSIWPIAMAQGKIAGHNAALSNAALANPEFGNAASANRIEYAEIQPFTNLKIKGIVMFSIGDISGVDCENVSEFEEVNKKYIKFFIKNNAITGAIVFGDASITMKIKKAVEQKTKLPSNSASMKTSELLARI